MFGFFAAIAALLAAIFEFFGGPWSVLGLLAVAVFFLALHLTWPVAIPVRRAAPPG